MRLRRDGQGLGDKETESFFSPAGPAPSPCGSRADGWRSGKDVFITESSIMVQDERAREQPVRVLIDVSACSRGVAR